VTRLDVEQQLDPVEATTQNTPGSHRTDELAVCRPSAVSIAAREIVERTRREQHLSPTVCDPIVLERLAVLIGRGGAEVPRGQDTLR